MKDMVVKSNALATAAYTLSTTEQKLILAAITQVRRKEAITDEMLYSVTAGELAGMGGFAANHEYRSLKAATERLFQRYLTTYAEPNGGARKIQKMHWIQTANYIDDEGRVEIRFGKDILPYLNQLSTQFFEYRLQTVAGMSSNYGIRLYEFFMSWQGAGTQEIEIDWLRKQWELEKKYKAIKDLKKYVIEKAVADVNQHSDLKVTWSQRKTGRRVTHLQFQFCPKEDKKAVKRLTRAQIEAAAKPGETYEQVKDRLSRSSDG